MSSRPGYKRADRHLKMTEGCRRNHLYIRVGPTLEYPKMECHQPEAWYEALLQGVNQGIVKRYFANLLKKYGEMKNTIFL